ncbi:MAG: hypothetical protein Q4A41_00280 [Bacillota bacterium]|nr:hypothetical protein [Bacillota bacterium]
MSNVVSHKCPNCGSALNFSVADQAIKCVSCDSIFTQDEMKRFTELMNRYEEGEKGEKQVNNDIGWDTQNHEMFSLEGQKSYRCESCGGSIIADESVAATKCPYCDNPALFPQQLTGILKPDVIIPFAIQKNEMKDRLKRFLRGKFLVPSVFRRDHRIEESSGVYVPFWLFNTNVHADLTFNATQVTSYRSGDYKITETRHYICYRGGDFDFENIPADGSETMKDEYMDSIEPFHFQDMKSFDGMYMAGFLADKYTVSSEQNIDRVNSRVATTCTSELGKTLVGFTSYYVTQSNITNREKGSVKYAMMPVWIMATRYKGKVYEFVMNGQTGKVVGSVPISLGRCAAMFGILTAVGAVISAVVTMM